MDRGGNLTDKGIHCQSSSTVEQKLDHQSYMDAYEQEFLSNKNKAIQSHWNNGSGYGSASGQFSDRLYGHDNTRIFSFVEENSLSLVDGNLNKRKRELDNHFRNDSLVSMPLSKNPNYWNAGGSRVIGGLIHGVESSVPISLAQSYNREEDNRNTMNTNCQRSNNGISLAIPTGPDFTTAVENVGSLAPTFSKENGNFILMGYHHNRADRGFLSMGQNLMLMGHPYETGNGNVMSIFPSYNNVHENLVMSGAFGKKEHTHLTPVCTTLTEGSEVLTEKSTKERSAYQTVIVAQTNTIKVNNVPKWVEKAAKKNSPNSFPSNVKSLLSTGILDGVPVKYVSWSREKSIRGIIKGTGYLCGCDDCKMNKKLNAFEFERHAGCKTKHPNNHIYFVSGKTIYSVVQDLKGTQQEMLFGAIKNATGSPINIKNYRVWKASYQAATRELQRIYGKD